VAGLGGADLARAAKLLSEVRAGEAEADLAGVEAAEADAGWLRGAEAAVRRAAEAALAAGLAQRSQPAVGAAACRRACLPRP